MADWPGLTLLKQALGVTHDNKDDLLEQALGAAIEGVVNDCGGSPVDVTFSGGLPEVALRAPEPDEPVEITVTNKLAEAALLLAVTVTKAPDAPFGVAATFDTGGIYVARSNPIYLHLLKSGRVRFGVA